MAKRPCQPSFAGTHNYKYLEGDSNRHRSEVAAENLHHSRHVFTSKFKIFFSDDRRSYTGCRSMQLNECVHMLSQG